GHALLVRAVLHRLLEARVQVPDVGLQRDDALALEVDDEPEHAVRARVLRPDVAAHPLRLERAEVLVPGRAGLGQLRRHQLSPASSASRLLVRRERGWGSWTER